MRTIRVSALVWLLAALTLLGCQSQQAQVVPSGEVALPAQPAAAPATEPPAPTATAVPSPTPRPTVPTASRHSAPASPVPAAASSSADESALPTDDLLALRSLPKATKPAPAQVPRIPSIRQLTTDGCCVQPFWAPDGRRVLFIDKPSPSGQVGLWSVDTSRPGAAPELYTPRLGFYTGNMAFLVELTDTATTLERVADGTRWTVPANGRSVAISPSHTLIAWQMSDSSVPFERRVAQIWVANLDGSNAHVAATVTGGGLSGWITDDLLLLSRRETTGAENQILYTHSLSGAPSAELVRSDRLSGGLLSPDGRWLVYSIALSQDTSQNGVWAVRTDGSARRRLDRALYGSYQWRDAHRLLIVPFKLGATSHELWQYDVETGEAHRLTDPAVTPFKIANADWRVSPDGRAVVFVSSADDNLWLVELGD